MDPPNSTSPDGTSNATAPVIGRSTSEIPTSADVHLYADRSTYGSARPILYADCEGFQGGERDPAATVALPTSQKRRSSTAVLPQASAGAYASPLQRLARGTKRKLKWARRDSPEYEIKSKRGYAVTQMYPRVFYAFSDVIVFVLVNQR